MGESVPIGHVRHLLRASGHLLGHNDGPDGLALAPSGDIELTLALRHDVTLCRPRRSLDFLGKPDAGAILDAADAPDDFRRGWSAMLETATPGHTRDVLGGLATWIATRLITCERVHVWPCRPFGFYGDYHVTARAEVAEALKLDVGPSLFRRHIELGPSVHAAVLRTASADFPEQIATYVLFCSLNFAEIGFAGDDGSEALVMHHHDKVIASIPDDAARMAVVAGLRSNPSVFLEISDEQSAE